MIQVFSVKFVRKIRVFPVQLYVVLPFIYSIFILEKSQSLGHINITYCNNRSHCVVDFISHSFSVDQVRFISQHLLRDYRNKKLLDIGSRTGALLYGVSDRCSPLLGRYNVIYGLSVRMSQIIAFTWFKTPPLWSWYYVNSFPNRSLEIYLMLSISEQFGNETTGRCCQPRKE